MSFYNRLQERLLAAESGADNFMLDQIAYALNLAHRASIFGGDRLVENLPKLRAAFEDCRRQESAPIQRSLALLLIADDINREDHLGYVSDLIRKYATDGWR